jgi:hypothetical protein
MMTAGYRTCFPLLLLAALLGGCASAARMPVIGSYSLPELSERIEERRVDLSLRDGTRRIASDVVLRPDSTFFQRAYRGTKEPVAVSTREIRSISVRPSGGNALVGLAAGTAVGIIAYALASPGGCRTDACTLESFEELFARGLIPIGMIAGAIVGARYKPPRLRGTFFLQPEPDGTIQVLHRGRGAPRTAPPPPP